MKELFDRHQDRLTPEEERRLRGALFDELDARRRPAWRRWTLPAGVLAGAAAAVVAVALVLHGPADRAVSDRLLQGRPAAGVDGNAVAAREAEAPETAAPGMRADAQREAGAIGQDQAGAPAEDRTADRGEVPGAAGSVAGGASEERAAAPGSETTPPETKEAAPPAPLMATERFEGVRKGAAAEPEIAPAPSTPVALTGEARAEAKTQSNKPSPPRALALEKQLAAGAPEPNRMSARAEDGVIRGRVTDAAGAPLAFVNVVVQKLDLGALTDTTGAFTVKDVPPGTYTVRVSFLGYEPVERTVRVGAGGDLALDVSLKQGDLAQMQTTEVGVKKAVGAEKLERLPADSFREKTAIVDQAGESHHRGGRAGEAESDISGIPVAGRMNAFTPPMAPSGPRSQEAAKDRRWPISVGGTDPVNGQAFDAMFFEHYGVNPFIDPEDDRFATFAVDVDNASYTLVRSYLERGELPPKEAVRVEEFVNAFRHHYAPPVGSFVAEADRTGYPSEHGTFAIHLEAAPSPFGRGLTLLRVGLKGREIDTRDRKPAVLTFVIDVSGSMGREDRLELAKKALHLLLDQMNREDEVGIVVYGSDARVVLPHTSLRHRGEIEDAIDRLHPEGATNAEAGLRTGYALADRSFVRGYINRVILCSDGVANVGNTGAGSILAEIKQEARRGIELTAVGFGMGNYNDVLMEKLADQGDGNYYYVDDLREARRVFVENLTGTLQTIARQVKIQVEFNPDTVRRYRLLGYENRDVADRDFRNDAVDAGEVGAGHEVTALFELKPERSARRGDLATVRIRYEDPATGRVTEEARTVRVGEVKGDLDDADPTFLMDAAAAEFAEILRHSYWAKDGDLARVVSLAKAAERRLGGQEDVEELVGLAETAWRLQPRNEKPAWRDDVRPLWEPDDDHPQEKQR